MTEQTLRVGDSMELLLEFGAPFSWSATQVEGALHGDYQAWVADLAFEGVVVRRRNPRPFSDEESTGIPFRTFTESGKAWRQWTYWEVVSLDPDSELVFGGFFNRQTSLVPSGLVVAPVVVVAVLLGLLVLGAWATYFIVKEVRVILRESGGKVLVIVGATLAGLGLLAFFFWQSRSRAPALAA